MHQLHFKLRRMNRGWRAIVAASANSVEAGPGLAHRRKHAQAEACVIIIPEHLSYILQWVVVCHRHALTVH